MGALLDYKKNKSAVFCNMSCRQFLFFFWGFMGLLLILLPVVTDAGEVVFVPSIGLVTEYDDNIEFRQNSDLAVDDFAGSAIPEAKLQYHTERLDLNALARLDFIKYLNETDFDRTNHLYRINTDYLAHPRWKLSGGYRFRRDETTDSQFLETGRSFERRRVQRHDARAGVLYNLTELTDVGPFVSYVRTDYSGRFDTDYDLYIVELPLTKRFQNERDKIKLTPAYSRYKSDDNEEAHDYRFTFGWERFISETLTFDITLGPRYTIVEETDGSEDGRLGVVGNIGLSKIGETFTGNIRFSHDLRPTSNGEIINVSRLRVFLDKRMTERFGARFTGNAYYSDRENTDAPDDKIFSFTLLPTLYYQLTENHSVELAYNYRNQRELDEPGNPVTQRNVVWLGLVLQFPQKWN